MKLKFTIIALFFILITVLPTYASHIPTVIPFTTKYETRFTVIGESQDLFFLTWLIGNLPGTSI